ncbi:MAG: ATP-dependent Clp protease proteolytic subunit [Geodermatophilaceae bacterium]
MMFVRPDIQTVCHGSGRLGRRGAARRRHARASGWRCRTRRILIHQPSGEGERVAARHRRSRPTRSSACAHQLEKILARHTGQSEETIRTDIERDKIFGAQEAKAYGLVDNVIESRKLNAVPA